MAPSKQNARWLQRCVVALATASARSSVGVSAGQLLITQPSGGVSAGDAMAAQTARPSLVVMFADNLGYGDVGALGAPSTRTPNVDSLVSHRGWALREEGEREGGRRGGGGGEVAEVYVCGEM